MANTLAIIPVPPRKLRRFHFVLSSIMGSWVIRSFVMSRQGKAENVASCGDGHILLTRDGVSHRRSAKVLPGVEMPEWLPGLRVYSFERAAVIAEKDQTCRGRHGAAGGMSVADLRIFPRQRIGL